MIRWGLFPRAFVITIVVYLVHEGRWRGRELVSEVAIAMIDTTALMISNAMRLLLVTDIQHHISINRTTPSSLLANVKRCTYKSHWLSWVRYMAARDNLHGDEVPFPIGQSGFGDIISHLYLTSILRVNLDITINRGIVIFPINSHTTDNTSSRMYQHGSFSWIQLDQSSFWPTLPIFRKPQHVTIKLVKTIAIQNQNAA